MWSSHAWTPSSRRLSMVVKHYRAHMSPIPGVSTSADGTVCERRSAKVSDADMTNIIKLGFTPKACYWVHWRGKAQGILADSEQNSGTIRLYDGHGDGQTLETVEKPHRFPIDTPHFSISFCDRPLIPLDSTVTSSTASSMQTLSSIGRRLSSSSCRQMCRVCGHSRTRQACTDSRSWRPRQLASHYPQTCYRSPLSPYPSMTSEIRPVTPLSCVSGKFHLREPKACTRTTRVQKTRAWKHASVRGSS